MANYIPNQDSEFVQWLTQFKDYATTHSENLGLTIEDISALASAQSAWNTAYPAHLQAQSAAIGARTTKDNARDAAEAVIRPMVQRIQTYPGVTNDMRAGLGITLKNTGGSGVSTNSLEVSDERPLALIDISSRLRHVLRVENETATGVSKARPAGAKGCEVWRKVGEAPSSQADMQFVDVVSRSPFVIEYSQEDAGKTVHYMLRWTGSNGRKSPWSEVESATIAA